MPTLEELYGDHAQVLRTQFQVVTFLQHQLYRGLQNEEILKEFLRTYVPHIFSVGSGFVLPEARFSELVGQSRQVDVLIYDSSRFAPALGTGDLFVVRAGGVAAAIEVKTTLDSGALREALDNVASAKAVAPSAYGYIFAFNQEAGRRSLRYRLRQALENHGPEGLPDAICILNGTFVERVGDQMLEREPQDDQLALFYYRLMRDLSLWAGDPLMGQSFQDVGEHPAEVVLDLTSEDVTTGRVRRKGRARAPGAQPPPRFPQRLAVTSLEGFIEEMQRQGEFAARIAWGPEWKTVTREGKSWTVPAAKLRVSAYSEESNTVLLYEPLYDTEGEAERAYHQARLQLQQAGIGVEPGQY